MSNSIEILTRTLPPPDAKQNMLRIFRVLFGVRVSQPVAQPSFSSQSNSGDNVFSGTHDNDGQPTSFVPLKHAGCIYIPAF